MRKVNRRAIPIPWSLRNKEARSLRVEIRRHFALPPDIRTRRRAPFLRQILSADDVAEGLGNLFLGKCAYCEQLLTQTDIAVDHFRPISAATDLFNTPSPDHYGWFAYEWQNLLLICPGCQKSKRNLFPVDGPRAQILCTWNEAKATEAAELLDPCVDNPIVHLRLRSDGRLEPKTRRGEVTIEVIDLNRQELVNRRKQLIDSLAYRLRFIISEVQASNSPSVFKEILFEGAEFAGTVRLLFRSIYDQLPRSSRARRFPSSDFERTIPELLQAIPSNHWADAWHRFSENIEQQLPTIYERMPDPANWRNSLEDDRAASRYISAISLRHFKGFQEIHLDMLSSGSRYQAPCSILLGENATGKSSILQAVCLALMSSEQRKRIKTEPELYLSRAKSSWHMIGDHPASVIIHFDDGSKATLEIDSDSPEFLVDGPSSIIVLAYGSRRIFKVGHSEGKPIAATNKTLFDPYAVIPDATAWLQECSNEDFAAVARAMNEVLALQSDDLIYRDNDGRIFVRAHGRDTPIQCMSDGYKSLFSMAIDIMRRMVQRWRNLEEARGIVLIDEIDTHLHPRWKMQVMGALRRSMPQVQFIATTHDPLCLRGMQDGEVQVLARHTDGKIVRLSNLPSLQGLRNEQLLTSDYFGLASTSDPEFERLLEKYAEATKFGDNRQENQELLEKIGNQIKDMTVIGDTLVQQVVSEALARYLTKPRSALRERRALREEAVQAVLAALDSAFDTPKS